MSFKIKFELVLEPRLELQVERILVVLENSQADASALQALLPLAAAKTQALKEAIEAAQKALGG